MKRCLWLAVVLSLLLCVGYAGAAHDKPSTRNTNNPRLLRVLLEDWFSQFDSTWFNFDPTDTAPTTLATGLSDLEGTVYYNDTANQLLVYNGSAWTALATGSGNNLDGAYNLGATIDVDGDAVTLTTSDTDNNVVLAIVQNEATNNNAAMTITMGTGATGSALTINSQTSGTDITGDSWSVTQAGLITTSGGFTISTADCLFDDTYDVSWDTSRDQLLFQDNAVLGIGGALNAAGDVTFKWDGTNLLIEANADDTGDILLGSTNSMDFAVYGSTATNIWQFDVSAAIAEINGWDINLQDDDKLLLGDSDDFTIEFDADGDADLVIASAAAGTLSIGDGSQNVDVAFIPTGGSSSTYLLWFDASVNTNTGALKCGNDDYGIDAYFYGATASQVAWWDSSADTWYFGNDAEGVDVYLNADTTGDYVMWDESDEALEAVGAQIHLDDDSKLQLGSTAGDVYLQFDGTNFLIDASTADEGLLIGDTTTGFDVTYAFETAGSFRTDYDGDFINLTDDMELRFGTGASSDGDFKISSNSSNVLQIEQVVADTGTITFGADGAGIDVTFYGEESGDYMKWDGTGASKLLLVGADSSGTLLGITGIDTTGNTDTVQIAHSGTGDALQITCTEADSVALNLVAAASQTTSLAKFDAATSNWDGADNIGMVHISCDDPLIHAGASLLAIVNSGQPIAAAEGFALRIVDTGTARTDAYAMEIETTNTTPALKLNNQLTISGADSAGVLFDITGIDTTGNTDTMQIAHSGTGDALQITCSEADSVALNLIAAASQTTSLAKFDAATSNWDGADNVGMVHISCDDPLIHTGASLLAIVNSGQPIASAEGFALRIVDTGTARTDAYAMEIETTNTTPALKLNNQMTISGADSAGILLDITGIDTTGNTDTMTIAHSGTGDALQITCTEADSVALNLVGATSQTTSILKVDGATGTWLGATGVGMVNLTNDGTPAHANASLLRIAQSGTNASGQRGICASLEDTSTSGGGTEYVLYLSSTNNEAIHVDSGKVLVDETITCTGGVQSASYSATATADGLTTGVIPAGTRFVTVTSDNADKVVTLPTAVIGNIITITVPATGAELETPADSNATINTVDCDGANQMAMSAAAVYQLTCVASNTWIAYGWTSAGAAIATIVPDAD